MRTWHMQELTLTQLNIECEEAGGERWGEGFSWRAEDFGGRLKGSREQKKDWSWSVMW